MEENQNTIDTTAQTNVQAGEAPGGSSVSGALAGSPDDGADSEPNFIDGAPGKKQNSGEHGSGVGKNADATDANAGIGSEKKTGQTRQQNAAFAAKRREAETARKVREAQVQAVIETLGGVNPYTGKPMKDAFDVDEYRKMREIDKRGGDVREDYAEQVKQERRDAEQASRREEWFRADLDSFRASHGDVDIHALLEDESFSRFADGKVGIQPLAQIYDDYNALKERIAKSERARASRQAANAKASPGALHDANDVGAAFFTPDQVRAMSPSEVHKNYEKIRESMNRWQ